MEKKSSMPNENPSIQHKNSDTFDHNNSINQTRDDSFNQGIISKIVEKFLDGKLSIMLIIVALCLGAASLLVTPREEEPQIVVPMADIYVSAPGATPEEIEQLVVTPLERFLWQIDGVEYVYSISKKDMALVTVRFYVGENREASLIKLHSRIAMNIDKVTPIVRGWVIKPVEIDDVPIVNLTLYSDRYDDLELRRVGQEVLSRLDKVEDTSRTAIHGGRKREVRVELLPENMQAMKISFMEVQQALQGADASLTAGSFNKKDKEYLISASSFLGSTDEVKSLVVGVNQGRPVYLRDIATVEDLAEEADTYTRIIFSNSYTKTLSANNKIEDDKTYKSNQKTIDSKKRFNAVTLAISKKKGTNAVAVAENIIKAFHQLEKEIVPDGIYSEITRNYGETAHEKVGELLSSLGFAVVSVVILLAFTLGWRESLIVAVAVPISFSLALFVNYLFGYTINRVTLFALILSLGLVVDDPITNVENIQRHIINGVLDPFRATLRAVDEVLPPVIMSTLAIIACFIPLFFITGMMGPYMGPMAANVPLTVTFSTLCALTFVPWLSYILLRSFSPNSSKPSSQQNSQTQPNVKIQPDGDNDNKLETKPLFRIYRFILEPFLNSGVKRFLLFGSVVILLIISCSLAIFRYVPLKLLPFDNKNEFQIVIDMDEGTTLERTDAVVQQFEAYLRNVPEVTTIISYTGEASPIDFNGMVRHYYLRKGGHYADIRVNLLPKDQRDQQSHAILLRLRNDLEAIAKEQKARISLVEVPPGPPVLSTIVGEIYAPADLPHDKLLQSAEHLKKIMGQEPFVVDINAMTEADHERVEFIIDKEKAALHGIDTRTIISTLGGAVNGAVPAFVHLPHEREPLKIKVILPRAMRSGIADIEAIPIKSSSGKMIPLAELVNVKVLKNEKSIYHKNLDQVVYVMADTAGRAPAEAVLDMQSRLREDPMPNGTRVDWAGEGEWKITIDVFRDMGIAFAAALVGIYILLIIQSGSFFMPILIMMAIPLTLLGIMPGFMLLNTFGATGAGGFDNPVFFTATSMIGMIALGGIVIRNSLVLIEFIQDAVKAGTPFKDAILQSGAIRMRPILLTALTTVIGAVPITLDPVFSGLAWALIFGLAASTIFTLVVIPVTYFVIYKKQDA